MKLHTSVGPNPRVVRLFMAERGIEIDTVDVDIMGGENLSDDFKALPSKFEIHEWSIMRDFCATVKDESAQRELLDAIHGSGAFRFFNSTIDRLDLRDDWFAYRDESMEQIAIDWLEANNIHWRRDEPS